MRPCYYFSYYDGYGGLTKQLIEKDRGWLWWIANHLLCTVEHNKTSHISAYSYFANLWQSKGNISTMNISDSSLIGQHMVVVLIQCPQNLTLCFKTTESSFPHLTEASETESQEWLNQERHKDQRYFYKWKMFANGGVQRTDKTKTDPLLSYRIAF